MGQLHVHSSFNNIIVSLANSEGQVISWSSAGKMGFRGSKKNTPYAAQMAAEDCAKVAFDLGLRKVKAYVKGPGNGRESAIRAVHGAGIEVTEIVDVTPLPHNGLPSSEEKKSIVHRYNVVETRKSIIIMARYIGPKSKIARRFGEPIFGADKVLSRRNFPPGQHGNNRRRKMSEYGVMLAEKQKAKYTYGVLERQFRNMFEKAAKADGITGEVLLQNLECRLDNVVFRLGIAPTRAAARQLVGHKHITVDGKVVNIPSYAVKPGQIIAVREKSKSLEVIDAALAGFNHSKYPWIEWDENTKSGKFLHKPERADIPENIKEQLIVELYSK